MLFEAMAKCTRLSVVVFLLMTACAPSARVSEPEPVDGDAPGVVVEPVVVEDVAPQRRVSSPVVSGADTAPTPTPRFDPRNPDWPLRYQELYDAYQARFEPPALESTVEVLLAAGREVSGLLLELGEDELRLASAVGEVRLQSDDMQPKSQALFFAERYAHFSARHHARREYETWQAAQGDDPAPTRSTAEVTVRPRNTQGVEVDPLHAPRRVRRNGRPPVNEEPTGRVQQVEEYILRHAGSPESLRVQYWGRVQPHGDGFTVRVRYTLEGAAGFGLSHEDMIFFMYADGTVYQRAAFRGN